jgi:hypothetical protein
MLASYSAWMKRARYPGRLNGHEPASGCAGSAGVSADWHAISEELQTALAQQAMHRAALIVAEQAEMFARQFTSGTLEDRGAEDALRLFAALLRETSHASLTTAGHA